MPSPEVRNWIVKFMTRHQSRFLRHDWPCRDGTEASDTEAREWMKGWVAAFIARNVTESEADAASVTMAATPPKYRDDHLPAILAQIADDRATAGIVTPTSETIAEARDQSRHCEYCYGSGLASCYHPHPDPAHGVPDAVSAHCICPAGRFTRAKVMASNLALSKLIPDFADVLAGGEVWLPEPPVLPGGFSLPATPGDLRAFLRRTPPVQGVA